MSTFVCCWVSDNRIWLNDENDDEIYQWRLLGYSEEDSHFMFTTDRDFLSENLIMSYSKNICTNIYDYYHYICIKNNLFSFRDGNFSQHVREKTFIYFCNFLNKLYVFQIYAIILVYIMFTHARQKVILKYIASDLFLTKLNIFSEQQLFIHYTT